MGGFDGETSRMEVIDERGRLFGRVNVIDALVVLVVLAVVAAGVALVSSTGQDESTGGSDPAPVTRYATLSLGTHPTWFASQVQAGDELAVQKSEPVLNVTDVHLLATDSDAVEVIVQAGYKETKPGENGKLRAGKSFQVSTNTYRTNAKTFVVGSDRSELRTATTPVVATANVTEATAAAVEPGDSFSVNGQELATVESVDSFPRTNGRRHVRLGLNLRTIEMAGSQQFTNRPLRVGTKVPIRTDDVGPLFTTVEAVGSTEPASESTKATLTVAWENVRPSVADEVAIGDQETHQGATARVSALDDRPATVVQPNNAGELVESDHPQNRDVTVTVSATVRRVDSGLRFHDRPLQEGESVVLEFGSVTVRGTVLDIETDD